MIYVTGGGGFVSREIVRGLVGAGQRVRVLVANPEEGKGIEGPGIEVVVGDRRQPATFAHTLEGTAAALLLTRNAQDLVEMDAKFSQAAKAAGVARVVKISAFGADANAEDMTLSYTKMSLGASAVLTGDVKRVLGRAATPFDQVAHDYAHLFRA